MNSVWLGQLQNMGIESEIPTFPADLDILCDTSFFTKSLKFNCQNVNFMFTHECSNRMLADQRQAFFGELVTTTTYILSLV